MKWKEGHELQGAKVFGQEGVDEFRKKYTLDGIDVNIKLLFK